MQNQWAGLFAQFRPKLYSRRRPLLLINGLAEQPESWYRNTRFWSRYFDVHMPGILAYDGPRISALVDARKPITVDYLVGEFLEYLTRYVPSTPCHIVSSSLGGKIAVELAVRRPDLVDRLVLICPSGMGDEEKLPIMDGVKGDAYSLVRSVFHRPKFVEKDLLRFYKRAMEDRRWKTALIRTVRGTLDYSVRDKLKELEAQTLLVTGQHDKICDPKTAATAADELPNGHFLEIPQCGHAPQIEKHALINRLVTFFLTDPKPKAKPAWHQLMTVKPSQAKP